jgi:hypothetical protein
LVSDLQIAFLTKKTLFLNTPINGTMKKTLLLSFCLVIAGGAIAQNLQFHDQSGNNLNGTTVIQTGVDTDYSIEDYIQLRNNGSSAINVKIKRYEVSVVSGTTNYFCWTVCYAPMSAGAFPLYPVPGSPADNDYVTAPANNYAPYQLITYHRPNGLTGNSTYRYVAYDGNNPNDSAEVFVQVSISPVSVEEKFAVKSLNIFPNPANNVANIQYQFNNAGNDQLLVVTDMIGTRRKAMAINGTDGTVKLDLNEFASGIYFITILKNGEAVTTRRLVVTH